MTTPLRAIFMGTPEFAVPALAALCDAPHCSVIAVVTQPDKPKGRGLELVAPPIKTYALKRFIPVFQPTSANDEAFVATLRELAPDFCLVVAYGKILRQRVLDIPRLGCFNVHASLLPKYRGAAPIAWSVLNGETESGISIMRMDAGMDTGDVAFSSSCRIDNTMTAGDLHNNLAEIGGATVTRLVRELSAGTLSFSPQNHSTATHAPKLTKEMGHIDWSLSSQAIHNKIRGLNPFPIAYGKLAGETIRIFRADCDIPANTLAETAATAQPGELFVTAGRLYARCGDGFIELLELQRENKKRMPATQLLQGFRDIHGKRFT